MTTLLRDVLDLVLPQRCAGCGAFGVGWCVGCAGAFSRPPQRVRPRVDPGVPCWALGDYDGVRRTAVVALKERGRLDLVAPLGAALAAGVIGLRAECRVPAGQVVLVPAPTRRAAVRARGGDPVARVARAAAMRVSDCRMARMLISTRAVADSVGLSAAQRRRNLSGGVVFRPVGLPRGAGIVFVDDVLTTGATAREAVRTLRARGFDVVAAVTLTAAAPLRSSVC